MAAPNCISVTKGAVASTTISEGENISGTVVSTIVTVWVSIETLPESSTAVQVTIVLPNGNVIGMSLLIDTALVESKLLACPTSIWFRVGLTASEKISFGTKIDGAVVSTTVIVWSYVAVLS